MAFAAGRALQAQRGQAGGIVDRLRAQVIDPEQQQAAGALQGAEGQFQGAAVADDPTWALSALQDSPESITGDPAQLARYNALRDGTYSGPGGLQDVSGYGDALQRLGAVRASSANSGTAGGRAELLGRLGGAGRLRQTAGTRGLDEGILGQDEGAVGALRSAASASPLEQSFQAAEQRANQRVAEQRTVAGQNAQRIQGAEGESLGRLRSGLEGRLATGQQRSREEAARLQGLLRAGGVSPELAQALGIDAGELGELQAGEGSQSREQLQYLGRRATAGTSREGQGDTTYVNRFQLDAPEKRGMGFGREYGLGGGAARYVQAAGPQSLEDVADTQDRARAAALQQLSRSGATPLVGAQGPATPYQQTRFDLAGARTGLYDALDRAREDTIRRVNFNARSGSGSALKKYGSTAVRLGGGVPGAAAVASNFAPKVAKSVVPRVARDASQFRL